jgi:hypothetical protein
MDFNCNFTMVHGIDGAKQVNINRTGFADITYFVHIGNCLIKR